TATPTEGQEDSQMFASRKFAFVNDGRPRTLTSMATAAAAVVALGLSLSSTTFAQNRESPNAWKQPAPKAGWPPGDRSEDSGGQMQGQTRLVDRMSGANKTAYNCNLDLVGNRPGEGAEWQMAWFKDCAYYDTNDVASQTVRGSPVIDVSDPANPTM